MKKKLIEFSVLEKIKNESLSSAQNELEEAALYLAKTLNLESLELDCYGPESVVFESNDGNHIHANYKFDNGYIQFDNVQELIINEESEKARSKEVISKMLDSLIESKEEEANELFEEWLGLTGTKKIFTEARKRRLAPVRKNGKVVPGKYKVVYWNDTPRKKQKRSTVLSRSRAKIKANKKRPDSLRRMMKMNRKRARAMLGEWNVLVENAFGYLDYKNNGPILDLTKTRIDENGNLSVSIPTRKLRTGAMIMQSHNGKMTDTKMMHKRNDAMSKSNLSKNEKFGKKLEKVRKNNALSDNKKVQESIEELVYEFPDVIYLTENELSAIINDSFEFVGSTNYDSETCDFIAEGVLRTAFETLTNRVSKILKLSENKINENSNDSYEEFKTITNELYKKFDENLVVEMQVYVDLYEAIRNVHELAKEDNDQELARESAEHLEELLSIVTKESSPSLEVVENAADFLSSILETNLETQDWEDVAPYTTVNGNHPELNKKAKVSYSPANDFSGHKENLPSVSDGKDIGQENSEELSDMGMSNHGGDHTYPNLHNPYLLNNDDYKISGEKDISSDSGRLGHVMGDDTWPNLKNPYIKN